MITLLIILVLIAVIGFLQGSFIALVVTIIAAIIGYFAGLYGMLAVLLLVSIGSGIQKFMRK